MIQSIGYKIKKGSQFLESLLFVSDSGRIQTCNPQSRNLMRYSVAPRGPIPALMSP